MRIISERLTYNNREFGFRFGWNHLVVSRKNPAFCWNSVWVELSCCVVLIRNVSKDMELKSNKCDTWVVRALYLVLSLSLARFSLQCLKFGLNFACSFIWLVFSSFRCSTEKKSVRINGALVLLPTDHLNNCFLFLFFFSYLHTKLLTAIKGSCMRVIVLQFVCYLVVCARATLWYIRCMSVLSRHTRTTKQ